MNLQNQVILVTGASRGIGKRIAQICASYSAQVIVGARTEDAFQKVVNSITQEGGRASGVLLDVTDENSVEHAIKTIMDTYQRIDGLVNCAGIIQYHTPVWQTSIADWDHMMNVNVRGTFLCCRAVVKQMVNQKSGKIVNLGSSSARMADDDLGPYTASKWAVVGYTTSLARSIRPHGIQVNGLNPGWVDTEMSRAYQSEGDEAWSTVDEIANAALYLLTLAPRDMTGQFIEIFR